MPGLTPLDLKLRSRRIAIASGPTRFFNAPGNRPMHITELEIDTAALSGQAGAIQIDIKDAYVLTGATTTSYITRKTADLKAGDVVNIDLGGGVQGFGGIDVNTNVSGPIVTLISAFQ